MSKISGQVDRLRTAAQTYRRLGNHTAEGMFLEAADTICELQTDNAKLREELADAPKCETCEAMLDCDECLRADGSHKERRRLSADNAKLREEFNKMDVWHSKELTAAMAENAKLRELVRDMMQAWWACDNEVCPRHDERCEKGKYCAFDECAQELGIEVDE